MFLQLLSFITYFQVVKFYFFCYINRKYRLKKYLLFWNLRLCGLIGGYFFVIIPWTFEYNLFLMFGLFLISLFCSNDFLDDFILFALYFSSFFIFLFLWNDGNYSISFLLMELTFFKK